MIRPKSCTVCGARTPDGASRCPVHKVAAGNRLRPCIVCGKASAGNYCEAHQPVADEAKRNAIQQYRKHYKTAAYDRNRRHRYERARGRCENCKKVLDWSGGGWQCDHIIPLADGGSNEVSNLQVLCVDCHKLKTRTDRRRRADG